MLNLSLGERITVYASGEGVGGGCWRIPVHWLY